MYNPEQFTVISIDSGQVLGVYSTFGGAQINCMYSGWKVIEGGYTDDEFWFPNGEPEQLPYLFDESYDIAADGVETVGPIAIPPNSLILYEGEVYEDEEEFSFSTAFVGEYEFEVMPSFPYRNQTFRIIAHAL